MNVKFDPLTYFPHEKAAEEEHKIPWPAERDSHDPGERAIAGWAAAMTAPLTRSLRFGTNVAIRPIYESGSMAWDLPGIDRASNVMEIGNRAVDGGPGPKTKVLGVLPVSERPKQDFVSRLESMGVTDAGAFATPVGHLEKIQDVVDSFIDKHHLTERGVRINVRGGVMSGLGGGKYNTRTREVTVPRVGKEILLHELGHAADYTGSRLGKIRGVAEPIVGRGVNLALPIALVAGDRIKEMFPGTVDDKAIGFMQDHAPVIMGATLAATSLFPEAKASFLAVRHIAEREGPATAKAALKKLVPFWGTYLLGAVPAIVGMSLARKYMRETRGEKNAGIIGEGLLDLKHVGGQLGQGALDLLREPGTVKRVLHGAKEVGASPEFVMGALTSAVPVTLGALYLYGTPSGKVIRERMNHPKREKIIAGIRSPGSGPAATERVAWRLENPGRFAGLAGLGAALSGGIMTKFISDLSRVM